MSEISCSRLVIWTLVAIVLQILGLSLFVIGFFPVKPALSGFSGVEGYHPPKDDFLQEREVASMAPDKLRSLYQELSQVSAPYDRLIFMVVDGLPAEFVLGKDGRPPSKDLTDAMPYTQSLLLNGRAVGYHAKAAPPTVTMPRLKAMVSGAIGGFLDVVFNFNTQALQDDNLLGQFLRIGWKMVMLGDETWIKLFPHYFLRQDGVSSFFVKDTVQVDQNVSRHLPSELDQNDWHLLILHYLGLDHVGHIGGRKSVLMVPKLNEMDEVIKMIHLNNILHRDEGREKTLLVVVSDHGMTDSGNHGGSSYEETDSLVLFIEPQARDSGYVLATGSNAKQVDITPTLAVLFGVPIPRNNVGFLMADILGSLSGVETIHDEVNSKDVRNMVTDIRFSGNKRQDYFPFLDDEKLRALELNSWQLSRLLRAQLPHLSCLSSSQAVGGNDQLCGINSGEGTLEDKLCCLYSNAVALHSVWKSKSTLRPSMDIFNRTSAAYYEFLMAASDWLSCRVVDKPVGQLALGILIMLLSCLVFLSLLLRLRSEDYHRQKQASGDFKESVRRSSSEENFVLSAVVMLVISMGSSSMVEEEQYIWHFFTTTLYWLLFRRRIQKQSSGVRSPFSNEQHDRGCFYLVHFILLLLSARFMRGWHQGGVNWSHLPDISKWLEKFGSSWIKAMQLVAGLSVITLGFFGISKSNLNRNFVLLVKLLFLASGLLVLQHIITYQSDTALASGHGATLMAQIIYLVLGIFTFITVLASPWFGATFNSEQHTTCRDQLPDIPSVNSETCSLMRGVRASLYVSGLSWVLSWSLLQLLLQQPVNSMPVFLLLFQIWITVIYLGNNKLHYKQWIEVATLYFLGMAGHFGLGNTNTLATIDVAGAFMGISKHSTLLSGVLMFSITYASPMMVLLSLMIYNSVKETSSSGNSPDADIEHLLKVLIGIPCLVPLALNSVLLTAYTFTLLLMRNHLFIWSVFSPKYMYVCVTTACIYIGLSIVVATELYIVWVCLRRCTYSAKPVK